MMNCVAGLIGAAGSKQDRSERLRRALACDASVVMIMHPQPSVSLAWRCDSGLVTLRQEAGRFAWAYGSGYSVSDHQAAAVTVDDVAGMVHHLFTYLDNPADALSALAGSFIIASGSDHGQLMVSGDPSGNRAPYYASKGSELAFANHPLICARLSGEVKVNRELEDFLLIYGFYPDGQTVYQGVSLLSPGTCLRYTSQGWVSSPISDAAHPEVDDNVQCNEPALYDRLYEVMLSCVRDQRASTPDVGVLLGGFDSALVAALLHRLGKRVQTYSFRYADTRYNQPHTDTLARHLGIRHHWVDITPEVIAQGLTDYGEQFVQPTNWLNYVIQTVHVCKCMRRDGIDYAYSGDGCDTLFLGYPGTYKRTQAFASLPQIPDGLVSLLIAILGRPWLDRRIGHPYRVGMGLLRAMTRPMPARAFLTFRVMDEVTLQALRGNTIPLQAEKMEAAVRRLAEPFKGLSIQRLGYAAKSLISPNRAKLIASTDNTGVRVHSPYLHPMLRRFTAHIPDDLLRQQSQRDISDPGKICLARMAERHSLLPTEIIHQPKLAAIDSPIDAWFARDLHPHLEKALSGLPFQPRPRQLDALIHTTWAERIYKKHIGSTRVISDAISLLATYGAMSARADHES